METFKIVELRKARRFSLENNFEQYPSDKAIDFLLEQVARKDMAIVALYTALECRDTCPDCGGKGGDYEWDGEDDVEWDPCHCTIKADECLKKLAEIFGQSKADFMESEGVSEKLVLEKYTELDYGLMERILLWANL